MKLCCSLLTTWLGFRIIDAYCVVTNAAMTMAEVEDEGGQWTRINQDQSSNVTFVFAAAFRSQLRRQNLIRELVFAKSENRKLKRAQKQKTFFFAKVFLNRGGRRMKKGWKVAAEETLREIVLKTVIHHNFFLRVSACVQCAILRLYESAAQTAFVSNCFRVKLTIRGTPWKLMLDCVSWLFFFW